MGFIINSVLIVILVIIVSIALFFLYNYVASKYLKKKPGKQVHLKILEPNHTKNTVIGLLEWAAREYPGQSALKFKNVTCKNWKSVNYLEYYDNVLRFAKCLRSRIPYSEKLRVAIIGNNSPEWFYAHLGTMKAKGVSVGMYPTSDYKTCEYIVKQAKVNVLMVEDTKQLEKFSKMNKEIASKVKLIVYYGTVKNEMKEKFDGVEIINYIDFIRDTGEFELEDTIRTTETATIIYTSGTTGRPKGAVIRHSNIIDILNNMILTIHMKSDLDICVGERFISYLPLNHIAAQLMDIYVPLATLGTVFFAEHDALKGSLATTLQDVKPTVFLGVPRVWEKIMEKIKEKGMSEGYMADILRSMVLSKIGLDECRLPITGSAPISEDTIKFFEKFGLNLCNTYGLSETTGPISVTLPGMSKKGSAGVPLIDTKIDKNGEILVRGKSVFTGYYRNLEKTTDAFTKDGWFKTGDLGMIDEDGYLYITGRSKDLIITAGGENIPPIPIENKFKIQKDFSKLFDHVIVIGDQRKFLSMLLVPRFTKRGNLHKNIKKYGTELNSNEELKQIVEKCREEVNKTAPSRANKIQKWVILDKPFIIGDEITPTLKIRRSIIQEKYKGLIDKFYE